MLDEIRNHDAMPTDEEREWMAMHEITAIARAVLLATLALAIGWGARTLIEEQVGPAIAAIQPR